MAANSATESNTKGVKYIRRFRSTRFSDDAVSDLTAAFLDMPPERLCGLGQTKPRPEHVNRNGHVPFLPACCDDFTGGELIADQAFRQPRHAAAGLDHCYQQLRQMRGECRP